MIRKKDTDLYDLFNKFAINKTDNKMINIAAADLK